MTERNPPPVEDPQALRQWLRHVLQGVEWTLSVDDRPYRAVARWMREQHASRRAPLIEAASDLLAELHANPSLWSFDAAGQLFALAGIIFADSSREGVVALQISEFVQKALKEELEPELILPAGSALLALRRHETPAFWIGMARQLGERCLPLVLEGIGRSAWASLLNWLPEVLEKTPEAEQTLINLLPYFASIRTGDEILRLADTIAPFFSKSGKADLKAFLARASIERPRASGRAGQRVRTETALWYGMEASEAVIVGNAYEERSAKRTADVAVPAAMAAFTQFDGQSVDDLFLRLRSGQA